MAKSENPIDVYRRQKRKKELKKNKTTRIKARDAKVAATRSLDEVKTEIAFLERKRNRNEAQTGLDALETKKLERLQKELRIVSAETIKRREALELAQLLRDKELLAAQKTVAGVQKLNESKYNLIERYASVYYDEEFNPYGVPAPGQRKLYWGDVEGKTTTMDSRRGVVPTKWRGKFEAEGGKEVELQMQQQMQQQMEERERKRVRRWDDKPMQQQMQQQQNQMMMPPVHQFPPPPPGAFPPPPPPPHQMQPPPPPPMQPPLPPPVPQYNNALPPPPPPPVPPPPPPAPTTDKSKPPALPAPSKAVQRAAKRGNNNKRNNAMADIWASQEEMEYESTVLGNAFMEGTAAELLQKQSNEPYLPRWKRNRKLKDKSKAGGKDNGGDVNDPLCPSADGYGEYRNRDQIERQSKEVTMLQKEQQEHVAKHVAKQDYELYNMKQSKWYYRDNTNGAIQGPFSGEQMLGWKAFFPETTPVKFGEDGDFDSLGEVDFNNPPVLVQQVPPPPPPPPEVDGPNDNGVDNNVTSTSEGEDGTGMTMPQLTHEDDVAEVAEPLAEGDEHDRQGAEMCLPPPSDDEGSAAEDAEEHSENNDATVEKDDPEVDVCLPPPSDDEADGNDGGQEADMCLPPPSDDEEDHADHSDAPYPAVGEYPLPPDEEAVPYPVDVEYPVDDDAYGYPDTSDAYGDVAGGDMAAVAPYPSADDVVFGVATDDVGGESGVMPPPVEEKKKEFKGDKAVVGFMPSHLRVKRPVAKKPAKQKPPTKQPPAETGAEPKKEEAKYSVADDYDKFMDEISDIK